MITLHLTNGEKKAFLALPEGIREGFEVEAETLKYEDNPQRKQIRFEIMDLKDPALLKLKEQIKNAKSEAEFMKIAGKFDLRSIPDGDLTQILFALGPDQMSVFLGDLLKKVKTREDVEMAAGFAGLRHTMLDSLNFSSVST